MGVPACVDTSIAFLRDVQRPGHGHVPPHGTGDLGLERHLPWGAPPLVGLQAESCCR